MYKDSYTQDIKQNLIELSFLLNFGLIFVYLNLFYYTYLYLYLYFLCVEKSY